MGYYKTHRPVKSSQKARDKNRNPPAIESKEPLKAFQMNKRTLSSQFVSNLSKKSGSRKAWVARSSSVRMRFRNNSSATKKKFISRQAFVKRQQSARTFSKKAKTTIPRKAYKLARSSTENPKNRFRAYRNFMDIHNKEKVARKLSEIQDPKERRCFLDYIATMRFEEYDLIQKYQFKKHKTRISKFISKLKKKSIIEEHSEESSSRDLKSADNSGGRRIMDRIKFQKKKLRRTSTQRHPPKIKLSTKVMIQGSTTQAQLRGLRRLHTTTQIPKTHKNHDNESLVMPVLPKYSPPILEEASSPISKRNQCSILSPDDEALSTSMMEDSVENTPKASSNEKIVEKRSGYFSTKKKLSRCSAPSNDRKRVRFPQKLNKFERSIPDNGFSCSESPVIQESDGSTPSQVIRNRVKEKVPLGVVETSSNTIYLEKGQGLLRKQRSETTFRPHSRTMSGPFNSRRIGLIQDIDKDKMGSVVVKYWDNMLKKKWKERDKEMDSPTFSRIKEKVVFSRNRMKVQDQKFPDCSEKSDQISFGKKRDLQAKKLENEFSLATEEAEDSNDVDGVGRMKKQLQGRDMNFLKRRRTKRKGYFFSKADQEAEIRKTISAARFLSRIGGKGSRSE